MIILTMAITGIVSSVVEVSVFNFPIESGNEGSLICSIHIYTTLGQFLVACRVQTLNCNTTLGIAVCTKKNPSHSQNVNPIRSVNKKNPVQASA